jgi:hypothetical protein
MEAHQEELPIVVGAAAGDFGQAKTGPVKATLYPGAFGVGYLAHSCIASRPTD